jgi:hypothetical protein
MKYFYKVLLVSFMALALLSCSETKTVNTQLPTDSVTMTASVRSASYPSTAIVGKKITVKIVLEVGFPCYSFSHFKMTQDGSEIYITPIAIQEYRGCTSSTIFIDRPYDYTPTEPGKILFHLYQSETEYYNFEVVVSD